MKNKRNAFLILCVGLLVILGLEEMIRAASRSGEAEKETLYPQEILSWQYFDEEGSLQMEFYFDEETEKGTGVYYGPLYDSAFDIDECKEEVWEDDPFEIQNRDTCLEYEGYIEKEEYNAQGKPVYFCSEAYLETQEESDREKLIEVEFIYREDGTLCRKDSYYHPQVWGTTGSTQTAWYDEAERISYVFSYITHGFLDYYYIYEGESREPSYCLMLDHMGPDAWAALTRYEQV